MPGSNGGNFVVPVGVELEVTNIQQIIAALQKAMSNVKPDTKGYSSITQELSRAEKKADSLASKLKQGFTNNAGIQNFTKGFEDLVAMVDTVNTKMSKFNFDNLTLTEDQQKELSNFAKKIQEIKNVYHSLESDKIQKAVKDSQQLQKTFSDLKIKVDTTTLEGALERVNSKLKEVQGNIEKSQESIASKNAFAEALQSEINDLNTLKETMDKIFNSQDRGADFSQFFDKRGRFKTGGRDALAEYMQSMGLDDDTINQVVQLAASKISTMQDQVNQKIEEIVASKAADRTRALNSASKTKTQLNVDQSLEQELQAALDQLGKVKANPDLINGKEQEQQAIAAVIDALERYKQALLEANGLGGKLNGNADGLKRGLDNVRDSATEASGALAVLEQKQRTLNSIKNAVSMWMGFNQVVRLTRTGIKNIVKDIRDLDKVMTQIAVVTKMTQSDLWNQMSTYQDMAKTYGVATSGVYQVSQIYYQQGLQTADVMNLTNETLKMAKIAGLDYSKAADYMTVAVRGFKMEMSDAQTVVDVYSNLAAKSAVNTTELATAMSKTASSAAAVGSSFENTSAMIAMMVETTRESAENIGSALKSIISRYGEMKEDPTKLIDSEGEALSLNKVDKALQSVGISLQDANHQFRDFDDVILELSAKWDTLDKNSQRYIATIMAGNRQQSRFLALVSDYDRLAELYDEAANSEDAALAQTLKTMDSLETKIQNVKNAFQGFYANLGLESVFKGFLDVVTNVINRLNDMPKIFGKIPAAAVGMAANIINVVKSLLTVIVNFASVEFTKVKNMIKNALGEGAREGSAEAKQQIKTITAEQKKTNAKYASGMALSTAGAALSTWALTQKVETKEDAQVRGAKEIGGGVLSGLGQGIMTGALIGSSAGHWGAIAGGLSGLIAALPGVISGINDLQQAEQLELKASRETAKAAQDNATLRKAETRDLENTVEKLEKLNEAKYDSNEAYQEWLDYVNQVASTYPQLISMYDSEGNAVINMAAAYDTLADSRSKAAQAALDAQEAQLRKTQLELKMMENITNRPVTNNGKMGDKLGEGLRNISTIYNNGDQGFNFEFTSGNNVDFSKDIVDQLFDSVENFGDFLDVASLQIKDGAIEIIKNWSAEKDFGGKEEDLQSARTAMADLFYEKFIGPLARNGLLESLGYSDENAVQSVANKLGTEDEITEFYLNLMGQIEEKLESNKELEEQLDEIEKQKKSVDNAFQNWAKNYQSGMDYFGQKIVSKFSGDSLMKSIAEKNISYVGEGGELNADGQAFMEELYKFYEKLDQDVYKQVTAILAHPENYNSQDELQKAVNDLLGTTELWDNYLTTSANGTKNYIEEIWQQNKNKQDSFQRNLKGTIEEPKEYKNDTITRNAKWLSAVGNGDTETTEIASKYLNNIAQQWTDLVSKQENTVVATQNSQFLTNVYRTIGEIGEGFSQEVNDSLANILTSAELDTRNGIQEAIDQIESYQESNEVSAEDKVKIENILKQLRERKETLLLNLNTEIQSYTDSLGDAIKSINTNYSKNTSGFDDDLKDANEILNKINARKAKSGEDQLDFNEAFKFDETLGKYVFTIKGLQEANNQVMQDLEEQYADVTDQLEKDKLVLEAFTGAGEFSKNEEAVQEQIASLSKNKGYSEEQQAYLEDLADRWKDSQLTWDQFIAAEQERLEQYGINIDQAKEAAENMTAEARKTSTFKALDISDIVKSAKTFEEVKQSIIDYYQAIGAQYADEKTAEDAAKQWFDKMKGGGLTAAKDYAAKSKKLGQFDPEVYNEILNQPAEVASSLLSKIGEGIGETNIQLTKAESDFLASKKIVDKNATSISSSQLAGAYDMLMQSMREGLDNGLKTLQDVNNEITKHVKQTNAAERNQDYVEALTSTLSSGLIDIDALNELATSLGTTLIDNIEIPSKIPGVETNKVTGKQFVSDYNAFLEWLQENTSDILDIETIEAALNTADKSKIADATVDALNSVSDSIATQIKNLTSGDIGKAVNITYLTDHMAKKDLPELAKILGTTEEDLQDGILTLTKNTATNAITLLKQISANNGNGFDIDQSGLQQVNQILEDSMKSAISELESVSIGDTLSANTAAVLADYNSAWQGKLQSDGTIVIKSASELIQAASDTYNIVAERYSNNKASLAELNTAAKSLEDNKNAGKRIAIDAAQSLVEQKNKITSDAIESVANSLGIEFTKMMAAFDMQSNGYYKVDNTKMISIMSSVGAEIDDYLLNIFNSSYTAMQDAFDSMSNGFSDPQDAISNLQKIEQTLGEDLNWDEIYHVDEISGKLVPTVQGLQKALEASNKEINDAITASEAAWTRERTFFVSMPDFKVPDIKEKAKALNIDADSIFDDFTVFAKDYDGTIQEAWDAYVEQKKKEIEEQSKNAEDAKKALAALKEVNVANKLNAIDFSGIASGAKTIDEVSTSIEEYLIAKYEGLGKTEEEIKTEAQKIFNDIQGGGKDAAEAYKDQIGAAFDPQVYNEILNQPIQAAKSLLDKLANSVGQSNIQLSSAEKSLADKLGIANNGVATTAAELEAHASGLLNTLREGLINGDITLQEYNDAMATANKTSSEKLTEKADALTTFLTSGSLTVDALSKLATSFGTRLKQNFNLSELQGLKTDINGTTVVDDLHAFLESFNKITATYLDVTAIENALNIQDKSKITEAAVSAENSIIESIANEISNIQSAGIDKKVNLTYLQNKIGDNNLSKIFGYAYENGILTVTQAVKANMYDSIKTLKSELSANGYDTSELDESIINYVDSAISELSDFTGELTVSDETAQIIASQSAELKSELILNGKLAIDSIEKFAIAANAVYMEVEQQYSNGLANLTQLNSTYANVVKSNLAKQSAGFNLLSTASSFDLSSLQNFLNIYDKKLSDYVDKWGDLTASGADSGLQSLGNGKYQIANWSKFINQLGITADQLSSEYIDAYVSWLQSAADTDTSKNARTALMTSLIPNMSKLTYAQIGQIAKTFDMTVESILSALQNYANGDGTFNGGALLNSLDFDKTNKDFQKALINQQQTVANNLTSAMINYVESGSDGFISSYDTFSLEAAIDDYIKGMQALGEKVEGDKEKIKEILQGGGQDAVILGQKIASYSQQDLSSQDIETLYNGSISPYLNALEKVIAKPGEIVDKITADIINASSGEATLLASGQYVVQSVADLYTAYGLILDKLRESGTATLEKINQTAALKIENRKIGDSKASEQYIIDALGDAANMTYTRFGEILATAGYELTEELVNSWDQLGIIKDYGSKLAITDFSQFADIMGWEAGSAEYVSAFSSYNDALIELNNSAENAIESEISSITGAKAGDWINLTQIFSKLDRSMEEIFNERYSLDGYNGNVSNLYNRPIISPEKMQAAGYTEFDGDYATLYSATFSYGDAVNDLAGCLDIIATPIQDLNTVLSEAELGAYLDSLVRDTDGSVEAIKAADAAQKNLILGMFEGEEILSEANQNYGDRLHQLQEEWDAKTIIGNTRFNPLIVFQTALESLGAKLENGILKIDEEGANIPGILATYSEYIQNYGDLTASETATLLDSIQDALKAYADLISNAAAGSLDHEGANQLQSWATSLGIDDLHFVETTDGLKLATDQAFQLAAALEEVDAIQGRLTFEKVADSLISETGSRFSTMSGTMAEIANAQAQIKANEEEINALIEQGSTSGRIDVLRNENNQLQQQIGLYERIAQYQSRKPESYNFMDQKLPDDMQGPINYWNSVGEAFAAMNEASSTGRMAVQDFYNIVTEMNNLIALSGEQIELAGVTLDGSAEAAAELINKGMSSLTNIDGKGVKVNLEDLGIDFASGADSAKNNFADGVHALAESQIAMLDAAIKVLEIVVAMEALGDIDVQGNNNGHIDLGEIFTLDAEGNVTGWQENFQKVAADLLERAELDKDLSDALDAVKVNGTSMRKMLEAAKDGIDVNSDAWKDLNLSTEQYAAVMDAFYQAMLNGDYNLENIQQSVWDILEKLMPDGTTIDVGDRTIVIAGGTSTVINWSGDDEQTALSLFKGTVEEQKAAVIKAITNYNTGKSSTVEVAAALLIEGKIEINSETGEVTVDGQTYSSLTDSGAQQALAKKALEDAGASDITNGLVYDGSFPVGVASGTIEVGEKKLTISYKDGRVTYHSDTLGQDFGSVDALMKAEYDNYVNELTNGGNTVPPFEIPSFEQWAYQEYGITVNTTTKFKGPNGSELDPANNPELQQQLNSFVNQSHQAAEKYIKENLVDNKDGTYTLTLMDGSTMTFKAENMGEAESKALSEAQNAVSPLIQIISAGIKDAFTSDTSIGEAIGEGVAQALSNYSLVIDEFGNITIAPKKAIEAEEPVESGTIQGTADEQVEVTDAEVDGNSATTAANAATLPEFQLKGEADLAVDRINQAIADAQAAESAVAGLPPIPVSTVNGVINTLIVQSINGAQVPDSVASGAAAGANLPVIPSIGAEVALMNIQQILSAQVDPNAAKSAASGASKPQIGEIKGAAKKFTVDELGTTKVDPAAAKAAGESATPPSVGPMEATATSTTITDLGTILPAGATTTGLTIPIAANPAGATETFTTLASSITQTQTTPIAADAEAGGANGAVATLDKNITTTQTKPVNADAAGGGANAVVEALNTLITTTQTKPVNANTGVAIASVNALIDLIKTGAVKPVTANTGVAIASVNALINKIKETATKPVHANTGVAISSVNNLINKIKESATKKVNLTIHYPPGWSNIGKTVTKVVKLKAEKTGNWPSGVAKGNVALAQGNVQGKARAAGQTLMGELGPELVVSKGKYFLVGEHGPELVDLSPDAIVFNHIQTAQLMSNGHTPTHGKPVTNERIATSLANGNFSGMAMSSASAALAELKRLRALWESLLNASLADMGGNSGGGSCFAAGTLVSTINGFKKIEDIEKGDIVLSYNEGIGENEYSEVLQTMIHFTKEKIYTLHIKDEDLVVTGIHRFLITRGKEREWIAAANLQSGDFVLFANGNWYPISYINVEEKALTVYNFEVSNNHNYYVGSNQVLAHNKGGGGGGSNDDTGDVVEGITSNVERWYNWLALIERTQNKINILTKKYDLLTAQGESSAKLAKNLKEQYQNLVSMKKTSEQLVKEQKAYRKTLAQKANKGLFGAFYTVDPSTGEIYLANDDAFGKYVKANGKGQLATKMNNNNGVIKKNTTITRKKTDAELNAEAEKKYKKKFGKKAYKEITTTEYEALTPAERRMFEPVKDKDKKITGYKRRSNADEIYAAQYRKANANKTKKVTTTREIRTGLDFMAELQAKNDAGNLVHNADDQYALIEQMGFIEKIPDLMAGVDKDEDDWKSKVVQNFYDKVENDKAELEALNQSIQEQEEAALEDAKAMQEINNQLKEMARPVQGITEHLEAWYTWTRKTVAAQHELNMLSNKYNNLQKMLGDNSKKMSNNIKEQVKQTQKQLESTQKERESRETERKKDLEKFGQVTLNKAEATALNKKNEALNKKNKKLNETNATKNAEDVAAIKKSKYQTAEELNAANKKKNEENQATAAKNLAKNKAADDALKAYNKGKKKKDQVKTMDALNKALNKEGKDAIAAYNKGKKKKDQVKTVAELNKKNKAINEENKKKNEANKKYNDWLAKNKKATKQERIEKAKELGIYNDENRSNIENKKKLKQNYETKLKTDYTTSANYKNDYKTEFEQLRTNYETNRKTDYDDNLYTQFKSGDAALNANALNLLYKIDENGNIVYNDGSDFNDFIKNNVKTTNSGKTGKFKITKKSIQMDNGYYVKDSQNLTDKLKDIRDSYSYSALEERISSGTTTKKDNNLTENAYKKLSDEEKSYYQYDKKNKKYVLKKNAKTKAKNKINNYNKYNDDIEKYKNGITKTQRDEAETEYNKYKDLKDTVDKVTDANKNYYTKDTTTGKYKLKDSIKNKRSDAKRIMEAYDDGLLKYTEENVWENLDISNPQKFIEQLTEKDAAGNSKFTEEQQAQILVQAGLGDAMKNVNGTQYFESVETATQEELNEAAKAYLEYIKDVPDEYNKALDAINEQKEKEEQLKGQILEYNAQLREMAKPVQGITEHLESWYKWTRKTTDAQNKLNLLTAQYSNLQKALGQNSKAMSDNLKKQSKQIQEQIKAKDEEIKGRTEEYENEKIELANNQQLSKFYKVNSDGSVAYNKETALSRTGKLSVTQKTIERDNQGNEKRIVGYDENGAEIRKAKSELTEEQAKNWEQYLIAYDETTKDISSDFSKTLTPQAFIEKLTSETNGKSNYSALQQAEILHAYGLDDMMKNVNGEYFFDSWDEANEDTRQAAAEALLQYLQKYPEEMNNMHDAIEAAKVESEQLKGQMLEINDQLREMAKPTQGITEHLESWYKWSQKLVASQNKLNLLTAQYNNLQKKQIVNKAEVSDKKLAKELQKQAAQIQKQQDYNEEIKTARETDIKNQLKLAGVDYYTSKEAKALNKENDAWNDAKNKLKDNVSKVSDTNKQYYNYDEKTKKYTLKSDKKTDYARGDVQSTRDFIDGIYALDASGRVVYRNTNLKTPADLKITQRSIARDTQTNAEKRMTGLTNAQGTEISESFVDYSKRMKKAGKTEEEIKDTWDTFRVGYTETMKDVSSTFKNISTPQQLIEELTKQLADGSSKYSAENQAEILKAFGFEDLMKTVNGEQFFENWDEASREQRENAAKAFLEYIKDYPETINSALNELEQLDIEQENLAGQIYEINEQIKELADVAAGVQNPFDKWYTWLKQIENEQNKLNILTKTYNNLQNTRTENGKAQAKNLLEQLTLLEQQIDTNKKYTAARQKELNSLVGYTKKDGTEVKGKLQNNNALSTFFSYDKDNGLQYNNAAFDEKTLNTNGIVITGTDENGLYTYKGTDNFTFSVKSTKDSAKTTEDFLKKLTQQNADNSMKYNVEQQFEILRAFGFEDLMQYDTSGNKIFANGIDNATKEEIQNAVSSLLDNLKTFQDSVDTETKEIQSLNENQLDIEGSIIDIKNQIQDNEISLENAVMEAIETREQNKIDELKEEKEIWSEAADKFVNGLTDQLNKEKELYERSTAKDELNTLQRQLAILQRSGGSSSQIRSLQDQIKSQQKDIYFDERQAQIDAIKEASDKQIEKLDRQIEIMEDTLTYNKENGLYWNEVRTIMSKSYDKILAFLTENSQSLKEQSSLQGSLTLAENGTLIGQWTGTRNKVFKNGGLIDFTGPAWVDGSPKKPEGILNADQTNFLRNELIDSLESFSLAINQFTSGAINPNTLPSINDEAGITIENLEFTMKVEKIANDYDATRAGQAAFDEMVRIARKNGNRSISRR